MMNIRTHPRGARPDFTILRAPNANETRAQQFMIEQLLLLEPGTQNGGGYTHKPGGHDTVAHNDARAGVGKDYTARDPQDRRGPRDKTRARDWTFRGDAQHIYRRMAVYGDRLKKSYLDMNDPRLNGWHEVLGQTDSDKTSEGINIRHRYYRTPDPTHEWHWHFTEDTEQVESFDNKWAFLTVLAGWTTAEWRQSIAASAPGPKPPPPRPTQGDDDMPLTDTDIDKLLAADKVPSGWPEGASGKYTTVGNALAGAQKAERNTLELLDLVRKLNIQVTALGTGLTQAVAALASRDHVDEVALVRDLAPALATALQPMLPDGVEVTEAVLVAALRTLVAGPGQA